jgi:type I restriction enzyme S subunit
MSDNIEYKRFGQLLKKVVDNRGKTCPTASSGIPLIATNCVKNENLYPVFEKVRYVSQDIFDHWFRGHPEPGDMIFVTKGTPGRVCWVPSPLNFCIAQDMVAIRADEKKIYPEYLFAALRSLNIQGEIENLHVGSLIPHFKKGDFNDLKIPILDQSIQRYIGDLYMKLSLKIDLLHRQNKTMEALAETLFRQWFVEEAEERWTHGSLGDISDFYNGKSRPESCEGGSVPIYGGNGILGYTVQSNAEGKSIVIGRVGAYCGSLYIENKPIWITDNALSAKPKKERYTSYLFYLLKSLNLNQMAEGSSHPLITQTLLNTIEVIIPSNEKLHAFCAYADKTLEKLFFNQAQIHTLTRLRNTLLPKLMSGEVRVTDVERFVETAP